MRNPPQDVRKEEDDLKIWDCGSPLYDAHELVALSHVVERHFMILPHLSGSRSPAKTEVSRSSSSSEKAVETRSEGGGRSLVLGFLRRNVWKKRKMINGEIKQKVKKQKTGISKMFAWKK